MALTKEQIISLGFKPAKKASPFAKKYDTLIFNLNKTDYLYIGYDPFRKEINYKRIWKSFVNEEGHREAHQLTHIGETTFTELKDYIRRATANNE